jgi:hypothetical protein
MHDERQDINVTSVQPIFSCTTKTHTTIGAFTEATYDSKGQQWSVPLIVRAGQLFKIGPQILSSRRREGIGLAGPTTAPRAGA